MGRFPSSAQSSRPQLGEWTSSSAPFDVFLCSSHQVPYSDHLMMEAVGEQCEVSGSKSQDKPPHGHKACGFQGFLRQRVSECISALPGFWLSLRCVEENRSARQAPPGTRRWTGDTRCLRASLQSPRCPLDPSTSVVYFPKAKGPGAALSLFSTVGLQGTSCQRTFS